MMQARTIDWILVNALEFKRDDSPATPILLQDVNKIFLFVRFGKIFE